MPKKRLIGIMCIEYWVTLINITGTRRSVGKFPIDASSISRSIVLDDNIIIKTPKTAIEELNTSLSKYLLRILIMNNILSKF